jgi:p-aminobenzoyl-glutamate transporter AbgT
LFLFHICFAAPMLNYFLFTMINPYLLLLAYFAWSCPLGLGKARL